MSKITCFTDGNTSPCVRPNVPVCTGTTRTHTCSVDTLGFQRVTRTHHDHNDTHNTTQQHDHNTTQRQRQRQTETEKEDRDRERREDGRGETRQEKREDSFCSVVVHGLFCWCSDFLVSPICARDLSLLNSVTIHFRFQCILAGQQFF